MRLLRFARNDEVLVDDTRLRNSKILIKCCSCDVVFVSIKGFAWT